LSKIGRKRKTVSSPRRRRAPAGEPPGDGGPDEAASFIADVVGNLARLAKQHRLDHLHYLLAMAKLEAEEHVRLRSRRRLS
jgi:hypothetical protein